MSSKYDAVEDILRRARARWRQQRLILWAARISIILAVSLIIVSVAALIFPTLILWVPPMLAGAAVIAALILLGTWGSPISESKLRRRLDLHGGLHDGALTAYELESDSEWAVIQLKQTAARMEWEKIRRQWTIGWSRAGQASLIALALAGSFLAYRYVTYKISDREVAAAGTTRVQKIAIDELLQDWEKANEEEPSEILKKAINELKPLQERLANGDLSEKEALSAISKVENTLQALQDEMKAQTMSSSMAQQLAQALQEMQGASGLAAALERHDLEAAEKKAGETAQAWQKPDAKALNEPLSPAAQQALTKMGAQSDAQKLGQMGASMRQLAEGARNNDAKQMSQAMQTMQSSLAKQSDSQKKQQSLKTQMQQLGACKNCMGGACKNPAIAISLMKSFSLAKGKGKGAGSESNPNLMGAETALNSDRAQEKIQGSAGEGESEITTEKTSIPTPAGISAAGSTDFSTYEKLSQLAVEDENIPLAHREAIKKYFATIHPSDRK